MLTTTLTLVLHLVPICECINVIIFLPGSNDDARRPLNRLTQLLAYRHHHVTTFRPVIIPENKVLVQERLHGVTELRLNVHLEKGVIDDLKRRGNEEDIWNDHYYDHSMITREVATRTCESILESDLFDKLSEKPYDVAVVNADDPCYLAIVHNLSIPFVYYDQEGYTDQMMIASGSWWFPFSEDSSFFNRLNRLCDVIKGYASFPGLTLPGVFSSYWRIVDSHVYQVIQRSLRLSNVPDLNEIKSMASAYMMNSDLILESACRPVLANLIYTGGFHIEYPRPLFPPYNITNSASDGVIIFSMGNVVNASTMPPHMKKAFLKAFSSFPTYRIYWKIGSSSLGDCQIPNNVNVTQYIPQNDLLAADETVLFISHGGPNSIIEAISYGVPVLGIPLYGIHYDNLRNLESQGAAIILHKKDLSEESIRGAMKRLLSEERYWVAARRLSKLITDRPRTNLEKVVHWIEYIGRHHGAPYHKSKPVKRLYLYQYLMIDVLIAFVCLAMVSVKLLILLVYAVCWRCA